MDDPLSELQALTSKRSTLRDRLKKRREALGSILAQTSDKTEENKVAESVPEEVKKPKLENVNESPAPRKRNSTSDSESKQDLMSLLQAQSAKEKEEHLYRDEIRELLGKPTAKGNFKCYRPWTTRFVMMVALV